MYKFPTINHLSTAALSAVVVLSLLLAAFFSFEPVVAGAVTDSFTVRQQVTTEISFITPAADIVMAPTIAGLTGGTANGTTTVAVNTNNSGGYTLDIHFASTTAMLAEVGTSSIPNYAPAVAGTPDYEFIVPTNSAGFAYSVNANTAAGDLATRFRNNGAACSAGAGSTLGKCWYNAANASSTVNIITRTTPTPSTGATTTIAFMVGIGANPSPAIATGWYNATATLTALAI